MVKEIEVNTIKYQVGPLTLRQVIVLRNAFGRWQKLGAITDVQSLSVEDARAVAEVAAVLVSKPVDDVLDWAVAHTIEVIVRAGHAFTAVNGPYLTQQVAPALEGLTKFATAMTAALSSKAA